MNNESYSKKRRARAGKRRVVAAIVAAAVALVFLFSCLYPAFSTARASSVSEAKAARDSAKAELERIKNEKTDLVTEYVNFDSELTAVEDQVIALTADIEATKETITQKAAELEEAIAKTDAYRDEFKQRARIMYENGSASYLEVLFGASSFSDFIERVEIVGSIASYDRDVLDDFTKNQAIIKNSKAEQEELLLRQENNRDSLAYRQEQIELLLEKQQTLIDKITADEATAQKAYSAAEKKYEEEERKAQEEIRRAKSTYVGSYTGGKFAWPAPSGTRITSPFGYRTHPISGKKGSLHRGIDIATAYGTNIVAGEAGKVIVAKYNGSYGRYVVIDHGNGYTTLYAHNSQLLVSVGQTVSRGQVIAKAGSTGNSTGPHCHFEVSYNGNLQNPLNYLK